MRLVGIAGLEPASPKTGDFKSPVSANFTIPPYKKERACVPNDCGLDKRTALPKERLDYLLPFVKSRAHNEVYYHNQHESFLQTLLRIHQVVDATP